VDLDLSEYGGIAKLFRNRQEEQEKFLKGGIETKNERFSGCIPKPLWESRVISLSDL